MTSSVTVDSNVLIYAFDSTNSHKHRICIAIATAARAGCTVLISEDMQDGRLVGGLKIANPFTLNDRELDQLLG